MENNNIDEILQQVEFSLKNFEDSKDFTNDVYKNTKEFNKILHLYENNVKCLHKIFPSLLKNILEKIKTDKSDEFLDYLKKLKELNEASENLDFKELDKKIPGLLNDILKKTGKDSLYYKYNPYKNFLKNLQILNEASKNIGFKDLEKQLPGLLNNILEKIKTDKSDEFLDYLEKLKELNEASENLDFKELEKKIPGLLNDILEKTGKDSLYYKYNPYKNFLGNLKLLNESKINFLELNEKSVNFFKILTVIIKQSSPNKLNMFLTNVDKLNEIDLSEKNILISNLILMYIEFENYNNNISNVFFENLLIFNEETKIINLENFNKNFPKLLNIFFDKINFYYIKNPELLSSMSMFKKFITNISLLNKLSGSGQIDFKKIYNLLDYKTSEYIKRCRNMDGEERIYAIFSDKLSQHIHIDLFNFLDYYKKNKDKKINISNEEKIYDFSEKICNQAMFEEKENFQKYLDRIKIFIDKAEKFDFTKLKSEVLKESNFNFTKGAPQESNFNFTELKSKFSASYRVEKCQYSDLGFIKINTNGVEHNTYKRFLGDILITYMDFDFKENDTFEKFLENIIEDYNTNEKIATQNYNTNDLKKNHI